MKLRFIVSEKSWEPGDIIDVPDHVGDLFLARRVVVRIDEDEPAKAMHHPPRDKAIKRATVKG